MVIFFNLFVNIYLCAIIVKGERINMRGFLKEKLHILLAFLIFYLIIEIIMFQWMDFSFLPTNFVVDFFIAFGLGSVIFLIRSTKLSVIYVSIILGFVIALFLINATMYSVYFDLFTLQQLQLIGEAKAVFHFSHLSWESIAVGSLISVIALFYMRYLIKKYKGTIYKPKDYYPRALIGFLVSSIIVFSVFTINNVKVNEYLEDTNITAFKRANFRKYGIFGYYTKELDEILVQYNMDESQPLIEEWNEDSPQSDYFGIMEGKNVITILMESIVPQAINETLTPNIYQLSTEGLNFSNSYSENKTNVAEVISIIGNYPTVYFNPGVYEYDFSYSFPGLLKEDGYRVSYFHDNISTFYSRGGLLPQLGFDNLYFHDDLFPGMDIWNWNGDYTLDSITMEQMLPNLSNANQPFYSYWATMSSHGPYNHGLENIAKFEEMGYFAAIDQAKLDGLWTNPLEGFKEEDILRYRHYQAAVMNLDAAIGLMVNDLETKGILDDTIIVMFGDHNVYYHNLDLKMFDSFNDYYNMEMYKNFFCIYNVELTNHYLLKSHDSDTTIDQFVSTYDIVPTLMDLLGYQFDTRLYLGSSIFTDTNDVYYSLKLTGFFDDQFFSEDGETLFYAKNIYSNQQWIDFTANCALIKDKLNFINDIYLKSKSKFVLTD